jgi:hypothetical protein
MEGMKNTFNILIGKPLGKRQFVWNWVQLGPYEHDDKPSGSIKAENFMAN